MDDTAKRCGDLFDSGLRCAESVLLSVTESKGIQSDLIPRIATGFLPMNLPYTMTPEMVADAARAFKPRILYPYHYGETDPGRLSRLLNDQPEIEVRIRAMK